MRRGIKKVLAAALCIPLVHFPPITLEAAEASYYYACAYEQSYIYEDADLNSEIIAVVPEGGVCRIIDEEGSFVKVFSGGFTGYMKLSWLDSSEETMEAIHSQEGIAADKDIKIYAEADVNSTIIAERKSGATEMMAEDEDFWDEEDLGDDEGWILIEYMTDPSGGTANGWVRRVEVTPARIVPDAEPYMGEDDGILIESSGDDLIEEANKLRDKADDLRTESEKNGKSSSKGSNTDNSSSGSSSQNGSSSVTKEGVLNRHNGTVMGPSGKETYYNLNMNGVVKIMRRAGFSEEEYPYWVREDGAKMLGPYIMCAADLNLRPRGSLVESSLGTCIVADTGDFIYSNPTQIDIATNW